MKKLLLSSAAVCGLAMIAAPSVQAQVNLEIGGFFKGYGAYVSQDEEANDPSTSPAVDESQEVNSFDIIRSTEVHFGGETTLDNGLSVGFHIETLADGVDAFNIQESYAYFSGSWGRVNFGAEDGSAYLLQVAAPSADSNIDGIRQYVNPVNFGVLTANAADGAGDPVGSIAPLLLLVNGGGAITQDYAQDATNYDDKFTYLSPIMNGLQVGASYTPDTGYAGSLGVGTDDVTASTGGADGVFGDSYEAALRYEGQFNNVGVIAGAGYTHINLEGANFTGLTGNLPVGATQATLGDATDDRKVWNVGLDLDVGPFGIGAVYKEDNAGEVVNVVSTAAVSSVVSNDEETLVVGADYTTGPFKLGLSYMDQDNTFGINDLDTKRYAGGVVYTYGPGMTLRGSLGYVKYDGIGIGGDLDVSTAPDTVRNSVDATYITVGTQINF